MLTYNGNDMNEQEAVRMIEEVLLSDRSIPAKLSMKEGIDEDAVARFESAVKGLIPVFRGRDQVPKKIAAAFLDLTPDFERSLALYSPQEQEQIEDLKFHVLSLAHDLLESE